MKTRLLFLLFIVCIFKASAQINPVENLTWSQWYEYPNNFFLLEWDEPAQPHNELIGYNIYRNNELYRFQTETSLYNLYSDVYGYVSNCDFEFLGSDNQNQPYTDGFEVHVTAVYNPGHSESDYLQSYLVSGPALVTHKSNDRKAILYPNPTNGIVYIENIDVQKSIIYDISGKVVMEFAPASQFDLSAFQKGIYFMKLFSEQEIIVEKIVVN